jgi:DNA repair exonuclease SbcCD nuclease subunit
MIFVTGDTHGGHDFTKLLTLKQKNPALTREDYVVIAGDFGGVWSRNELKKDLEKYMKLPYTVLFADGNHENFDLLDAMPTEEWNGGKIHRIADNIFHLMRGQVFRICGKTFFVFGGAESVDREWRVEGKSWWRQETPNFADYEEAYKNLRAVGDKVDYIITHTVDEKALYSPALVQFIEYKAASATNRGLSRFEETIDYGHWYFGHYHLDAEITPKKTALYNTFKLISTSPRRGNHA